MANQTSAIDPLQPQGRRPRLGPRRRDQVAQKADFPPQGVSASTPHGSDAIRVRRLRRQLKPGRALQTPQPSKSRDALCLGVRAEDSRKIRATVHTGTIGSTWGWMG